MVFENRLEDSRSFYFGALNKLGNMPSVDIIDGRYTVSHIVSDPPPHPHGKDERVLELLGVQFPNLLFPLGS